MRRILITSLITALALFGTALAAGCQIADQGPDPEELKSAVIQNYASGAHALYAQSLASAQEMDAAIDNFLANPTPATLEAAKRAWLRARDDYGPTEVLRFYGGPIDNEEDGPEGLLNAWPMDEAYVDYVDGDATAGIINDPSIAIDAATLVSLNEEGGEANVSTGWHAIEFLLWGQDMDANGPGARPLEDYTTNPNADRRAAYLRVSSDLLLAHLQDMVNAWAPGASNYRAQFVAMDADQALTNIITGAGALSKGELAGERMFVAYSERSQEDEHSCFSDNTNADIIGNARGVRMVITGDYGAVVGPGVLDLFAAQNPELAQRLELELAASVDATRRIPAPFDRHLTDSAPDSGFGRGQVLRAIQALERQADTIVEGAQAFGLTINTSV